MKINLRKANALQLAIKAAINAISVETTVTISRFENPEEKFARARGEHLDNRDKKISLILAVYRLRDFIAAAGDKAGVANVLANMAGIEKVIEIITPLAAIKEFAPSTEEMLAQFNDMKDEPHLANTYHRRRDEIRVNIVQKDDEYEKKLAGARVTKQELSDELLKKNIETEVELPDDLVQVLKKYDLM